MVDADTGEVVQEPVKSHTGDLMNPATGNPVIASGAHTEEVFKGVEEKHEILYGDMSSNAQYLGGLISENTTLYMVSSLVENILLGDTLTIANEPFEVIQVDPFDPGDVPIYQIVWVKR